MSVVQISTIILFASLSGITLAQPTASPGGVVTLKVYDADGNEVKDPAVHIKDASGRDFSKALDRRTMMIRLPVGDYELLLGSDKGVELQNFQGELRVEKFPQTKVIGLGFAAPEVGATSFSIRVKVGFQSDAKIACLLSGIFFDRKYVANVSNGRELEFPRVEGGRYLLRCTSEGRTMAFREVLVPSQEARDLPNYKEDVVLIE